MNVISSSYGNDSMAMIRWAHEQGLQATVVYCDTGWASPRWPQRVAAGEALAKGYGFPTIIVKSLGMPELVRMKKGWPGNGQQFCTAHLKGLPFLQWADEADPENVATVMIGKRRAESEKRKDTQEFIESSEHHGGRRLWHPLYLHTDAERNALLERAGFEPLPHRSLECNPCVNANRRRSQSHLRALEPQQPTSRRGNAVRCRATGALDHTADARHDDQGQHGGGSSLLSARPIEPGPVGGWWAGAEWIDCTDGFRRPVEPGTFPLVIGAASRVVRLRAYGNAIVAPQAEEFIRAYMNNAPSQFHVFKERT